MDLSETSASRALWKLSQAITTFAAKHRSDGTVTHSKVLYIRPRFEKFEFKNGSTQMQWTQEYVEKDEARLRDTLSMFDLIKKLPEYEEATKLLSQVYRYNSAQVEFWLSIFAQRLSTISLTGGNHEETVDLITTFISDLEGSAKPWRVSIWLSGMWTEAEQISLIDGVIIRHPKPADFITERPVELVGFPIWTTDPLASLGSHPSCILDIQKRAKDQLELQRESEILLVLLRLFRVGAVIALRAEWKAKSVTQLGTQISGGFHVLRPGETYSISIDDDKLISEFVTRIKPLIRPEYVFGGERLDNLATSLQRYQDALVKPEPAENRITFAIMSSEALYLKEGERLPHQRISQRIAKVLETFGADAADTYNLFNRTYTIRSKFVHGESLEKKHREYSAQVLGQILDYTRLSILAFLQLRDKIPQSQFLDLVDMSLLSDSARSDLREKLKEWVPVRPVLSSTHPLPPSKPLSS